MILCINTKDQKKVEVFLKKDGKVVTRLEKEREYGSQVLLPLILKLLKNPQVQIQFHPKGAKLNWELLEGIEVETGPGSFTGIRVGVAVANSLGYSLGIPVNGKRLETELQYL